MKSELYFRLGEMEGFTSIKLADKREGWATPVRELVQNSLDAALDPDQCEIDIHIQSVANSNIPHIEKYKDVLGKAIATQTEKNSYNDNSKRLVESINQALKADQLSVLMFADNGAGMSPDKLNGLLDERSVAKDAESVGSFGVGHLSCYSLSSLRYVLYATKYKDSQEKIHNLFTGSPILAGYQDTGAEKSQRSSKGRILTGKPNSENNPQFDFPDQFPNFIRPKMYAVKETGSLVAILGLTEEWNEEAEYAIVSNYFHAIVHGGLSITVHQDGQKHKISTEQVEQLIANKKDEKNKRGENILSGKAVYQALKTVEEDNTQKEITLGNAEKVAVCIRTDADFDSTIVLVRNGMVVARHDSMLSNDLNALRKNPKFNPFTAVIDVKASSAPELFRLVKGAESHFHNRLRTDRLDPKNEKQLKELLKDLSEGIAEHLTEVGRDSFFLPLFTTPAESANAQAVSGITKGQSGQGTPHERRTRNRTNTGDDGKGNGGEAPKVSSRRLDSSNAVRYEDEDGQWKVYMRITPNQYKDTEDSVYLSVFVGEDHDQDKAGQPLDLLAVSIGPKSINIDNSKAQELTGLKQGEQCDITAEVKKPAEIGDMKVSLLPVLGVKKRTKTNQAKPKTGN